MQIYRCIHAVPAVGAERGYREERGRMLPWLKPARIVAPFDPWIHRIAGWVNGPRPHGQPFSHRSPDRDRPGQVVGKPGHHAETGACRRYKPAMYLKSHSCRCDPKNFRNATSALCASDDPWCGCVFGNAMFTSGNSCARLSPRRARRISIAENLIRFVMLLSACTPERPIVASIFSR